MKKTILMAILAILLTGSQSLMGGQIYEEQVSSTDSFVTQSFSVSGNCGMCKATIEKAALSVSGVSTAVWDASKKTVTVTYSSNKTTINAIHKAIALAGYDTNKVRAKNSAYNKLPSCCQYDRKP